MKRLLLTLAFLFPSLLGALETSSFKLDQTAAGTVGLIDSYRKALQKNERIASAEEDYIQTTYFKKLATAAILPDITLQGSYFKQESIPSSGLPGQSFLLSTRTSAFARIEQPLFSGFRELNARRSAGHLMRAGEQNLRQTKDQLLNDVAFAFYLSLQLQQEVETIQESLQLQRERLREVEARQKIGLARRTEVLLIETQFTRDQSNLLRAQNNLDIARENLNFVVGERMEGRLVDDISEIVSPLDEDALVRAAVATRGDVKESAWRVEAAKSQVSVVRGEYFPELELVSNLYGHREGIQAPVTWDIEFVLKFPVFWGRDVRARELQALSRKRQAELNLSQLQRQVELQVKSAIRDWESSDSLIKSLQKERDVADENYRLIQEEYRIGLSDNLEVLTSYLFLQNAKLDLEKEKINRKLVWIRMQTALGENPVTRESAR